MLYEISSLHLANLDVDVLRLFRLGIANCFKVVESKSNFEHQSQPLSHLLVDEQSRLQFIGICGRMGSNG